ncbi:MAG: L,D-transpeptidase [Prosthecobacter sp.]|jgi:hypothetical protein|uniref:L,D-transpeptidase n=1 Tax=Prosthecobacter sp. TaxID=1965333 RepID=UPI0019F0F7FF|nr:L,D-transpeptidase [Prosthecobacter sp.]MBE2283998.1 L,D-transpeptidase [Prosthecobacter sp.]
MTSPATKLILLLVPMALGLASCCQCPKPANPAPTGLRQRILVSIPDQTMQTYEEGKPKRRYPVSTSRFGVGDRLHSNRTPLGRLQVVEVIGEGLPKGMRLACREPTGQIVKKNTPGCDVIVTRIVRLRGTEPCNARTYRRCIYIHGTTNEKDLKKPVSWGCVRMGSSDIIRLCKWVQPGAEVDIIQEPLPPGRWATLFKRMPQPAAMPELTPASRGVAATAPPETPAACKPSTADLRHSAGLADLRGAASRS